LDAEKVQRLETGGFVAEKKTEAGSLYTFVEETKWVR
jgi:hypothetical protein